MTKRFKESVGWVRSASSGSTLVMVVIIAAVAVSLLAAVTTSVLSANAVSANNASAQQAYFTARSAVNATMAQINDTSDIRLSTAISTLNVGDKLGPGTGSLGLNNDYSVIISKKTATSLKITGTGTYGGATRKVTANLAYGLNPLSNLVYVSNASGSSISPSQCFGNILFDGSLDLTGGSGVDGNVFVSGDLTVEGGSHISQNALVGGKLTMKGDHISGSAVCAGKVDFSGQSRQIWGGLTYKGDVTVAYGSLNDFASPANKDPNLTATLPLAPGKADTSLPSAVSTVVRSRSINLTGSTTLLNSSGVLIPNNDTSNKSVVIDTTSGDIYLLVTRSTSLTNCQLYVKGNNHLYIYLEGNSTKLSLSGGNPVIRMQDASQSSNIFVIGGAGTSLDLDSAEIQGYVYIPDGNVSIEGGVNSNGAQTGYSIIGSMVVKTATITANVKLQYYAANLDGTPLSSLNNYGRPQPYNPNGQNHYPTPSWQINSWSDR